MRKHAPPKYNLNDPDLVSVLDELPLWSAPFGLKLLETIRLRPNITVLDIGSGTGFPLLELGGRLGSSCRVYGIDPWRCALERIHMKMRQYEMDNVITIEGVGERMPFHDNVFDLIVANNGINNVEDPQQVLMECFRVGRSKAQMVLTLNLPDTMREFYDVYESVLKEHGKDPEIEKMKEHIEKKRMPLEQLRARIKNAGFDIEKEIDDAFLMRYMDGTAFFRHYFVTLAFQEGWESILRPQDVRPVFQSIEARLNVLAEERGGLYLTIPFVCIDCLKP